MSSTVQTSSKLLSLIDKWADSCIKSSALVSEIIKQAAAEGLSASDCRELLESALKKRGLKERQIRNLIPAEFKRGYDTVRQESQSAMIAESENSTSNDEDIAKLKEQFQQMQSEVRQLRNLLHPFKAGTRIEIKGNIIPLILEIDPLSRKVLHAQVNETEARRLNS